MKQTLSSPQCGAQVLSFWDEGLFAELVKGFRGLVFLIKILV